MRLLNGLFDLTEHDVMRNRVLVAEEGLIAVPRKSPREEEARRLARARMRDIEFAWAAFLTRGMEQGAIPEADPRLLTHAMLGLYKSVWHWYRPGGGLSLDDIRDFFVERCLAVAGYAQAGFARPPSARKPRAHAQGGLIGGARARRVWRRAPRGGAPTRSARAPCRSCPRTAPA